MDLARMGDYLRVAPWLVSMFEDDYRAVKLELSQRDLGACGTTILDYLPFDPTVLHWTEYQALSLALAASDPGAGDQAESDAAEKEGSRRSAEGPGEGRRGRPGFDREPGPRPATDGPSGPWTAGRPHLDCDRIIGWFSNGNNRQTEQNQSRHSGGRGMLIDAHPVTDWGRPVMRLLCRYLWAYWGRMSTAGGSADVFAAFPYDSWGSGRRSTTGWPSRVGGPLPKELGRPLGTLLEPTDSASRWDVLNGNLFVLRQRNSAGAAFGATDLEADLIGLALRLLEDSLPLFDRWQAAYGLVPGFQFRFGPHNVVADAADQYRGIGDGGRIPLHIILRSGLTEPAPDAEGRGHPPHGAISLNRLRTAWSAFDAGVPALVEFRRAAACYYRASPSNVSGLAGDFDCGVREGIWNQDTFWNLATRVAQLAEMILHEGLHPFCWLAYGQETGIAGDWHDGPTTARWPPRGVAPYLFPLATPFGPVGQGVGPPSPPAPPFWYQPLLGAAPLAPSTHYAVELFGKWWEALLRHNRYPLLADQGAACECEGPNDPDPFAPANPRHYGWWDVEDDGSKLFTTCKRDPWNLARRSTRNPRCRGYLPPFPPVGD